MDFNKRIKPASKKSIFKDKGYIIWCGTTVKGDDGNYYLYYSRWKEELGHQAWVTECEVAVAVADNPFGPFESKGVVLAGSHIEGAWDRDCIHNPTIHKFDGKYYLYHMGNYGDGEYWDHRNHQRVGVAVADNPMGPFKRFDKPLIDVREGKFDSLVTSNPSVTKGLDGRYYIVYKAVDHNGVMPKGGDVICGVGISDSPLGPFEIQENPVMRNPEASWSVEDPYIWCEDGAFYALVRDYQGYFTKQGPQKVALFTSKDGIDWHADEEHPYAFDMNVKWDDGTQTQVGTIERPQLLIEDGKVVALYCAVAMDKARVDTYNLAIPIE